MSQATITLIVLVVAIVLFVADIFPMGLVAFCVPVVLYLLGIIEVGDIFTDVINSNVILILAMCVIGAAFFKTGLAYMVSQKVMKLTHSQRGLILVITLLSGVLSGFVSNTGTVAVLLPIVVGIARFGERQAHQAAAAAGIRRDDRRGSDHHRVAGKPHRQEYH